MSSRRKLIAYFKYFGQHQGIDCGRSLPVTVYGDDEAWENVAVIVDNFEAAILRNMSIFGLSAKIYYSINYCFRLYSCLYSSDTTSGKWRTAT